MNDKCPIKYTTYRQSTQENDVEARGPLVQSESEITINEYTANGEVKTHIAHVTRRTISTQHSNSSSSSSVERGDEERIDEDSSVSGETEGADSECASSSESEEEK